LWTDESMKEFMTNEYPSWSYLMEDFNSVNKNGYTWNIQKIDIFRYFILYNQGGVYIDLDVGCKSSIDSLVWPDKRGGIYTFGNRSMVAESVLFLPKTEPFGVSNDFIASTPSHPFLRLAIQLLPAYMWTFPYRGWFKGVEVLCSTGPAFLDMVVLAYASSYGFNSNISHSLFIIPDPYYSGRSRKSFFFHVYGSSWHSWDSKVLNWCWQNKSTLLTIIIMACFLSYSTYKSLCGAFYFRRRHQRKFTKFIDIEIT